MLYCDEAHRLKLVEVQQKIEESAKNDDFFPFFENAFEFFYVSLETANNPMLLEIILDLVPGFRRVVYASFYARGREIKKYIRF